MSTQKTAEEIAQLQKLFDRHGVTCDNCGAQIIARGGTLGEHHGLSKAEGEEENLCGYCCGLELQQLETRAQQAEQQAERLRKALEKKTGCVKCKGKGFIDGQHRAGFTHYETDAGEPCPSYHYERLSCPNCAALAPQPTEAQEPTLEQLEREYKQLEREYIEACVRANLGPSSECEARSAECSARWEALRAKRRAIDAARKEAEEKPED